MHRPLPPLRFPGFCGAFLVKGESRYFSESDGAKSLEIRISGAALEDIRQMGGLIFSMWDWEEGNAVLDASQGGMTVGSFFQPILSRRIVMRDSDWSGRAARISRHLFPAIRFILSFTQVDDIAFT